MNGNQIFRTLLVGVVAVTVAACGAGLLRLAEITGSGFTSGSAQAFGSVVVNGVRYATDDANVVIDTASGAEADLRIGHRLLIAGTDNGDGTGIADQVTFAADAIGAIDSVDTASNELLVLGQRVGIEGLTLIYGGDVADLQAGVPVRVSGVRDAANVLRAGAIEILPATPSTVQVRGTVRSVDTAAQTLNIAGLTVDYSGANAAAASLAVGADVVARGAETVAGLQASSLLVADRGTGNAGDAVRLRGLVTQRSGDGFTVAGQSVFLSAGVVMTGGNADELAAGDDVAVVGLLNNAGAVDAATVEIVRPDERALPVEIIAQVQDASGDLLNALNLDIRPRSRTLLRDARDEQRPFALDNLQVGDWVRLRCFGDNGTIVVNRVERIAARDAVDVTAPVLGFDANANTVNVDGVPTNVSGASFADAQGQAVTRSEFFAALAAGDFVSATGQFDGTSLLATSVALRD